MAVISGSPPYIAAGSATSACRPTAPSAGRMSSCSAMPCWSCSRFSARPRCPGRRTALDARARRICAARGHQPVGLTQEGGRPAERRRVVSLHQHRRPPSFLRIGAPEARQRRRSASRRSAPARSPCGRRRRRRSAGSFPWARRRARPGHRSPGLRRRAARDARASALACAGARSCRWSSATRTGRSAPDRREVGTPNASGSGVNTGVSPPCGATLRRIRIGTGHEEHEAALRCARQIGGEAGDVMAAADDDGARAAALRALDRVIDGAQHEPRTRQPLAVPQRGRGALVRRHGSCRSRASTRSRVRRDRAPAAPGRACHGRADRPRPAPSATSRANAASIPAARSSAAAVARSASAA